VFRYACGLLLDSRVRLSLAQSEQARRYDSCENAVPSCFVVAKRCRHLVRILLLSRLRTDGLPRCVHDVLDVRRTVPSVPVGSPAAGVCGRSDNGACRPRLGSVWPRPAIAFVSLPALNRCRRFRAAVAFERRTGLVALMKGAPIVSPYEPRSAHFGINAFSFCCLFLRHSSLARGMCKESAHDR
jgi:hypothetical protein